MPWTTWFFVTLLIPNTSTSSLTGCQASDAAHERAMKKEEQNLLFKLIARLRDGDPWLNEYRPRLTLDLCMIQ
jgi:hypothetical protein